LSPRHDIGIYSSGRKKKKLKDTEKGISENSLTDIRIEEQRDPALIVSVIVSHIYNTLDVITV